MEPPSDDDMRRWMRAQMDEILKSLSELERDILIMRFGIEGGCSHTLGETGKAFGLSAEGVRQIEASALRKLRNPSGEH